MTFNVQAKFIVKFLNPDDMTGNGIKTICEIVTGKVEADRDDAAAEAVRAAIRRKYPVCWSMKIGKVTVWT